MMKNWCSHLDTFKTFFVALLLYTNNEKLMQPSGHFQIFFIAKLLCCPILIMKNCCSHLDIFKNIFHFYFSLALLLCPIALY